LPQMHEVCAAAEELYMVVPPTASAPVPPDALSPPDGGMGRQRRGTRGRGPEWMAAAPTDRAP